MCASVGTMIWEHWDSNLGPGSSVEIFGFTRSSSMPEDLEISILWAPCPVQTPDFKGGFECKKLELGSSL